MQSYTANRFTTAPMLDWTDRHCLYFWRLMTRRTMLYTEMITTGAIIFSRKDMLEYNEEERPLALQLGGSCPSDLAKCAKLAEDRGYSEINLNVGCPSDRVQNGGFGAALMAKADTVADCFKAMKDTVDIPVTIKCRIGIDKLDTYEFLSEFIETQRDAGCDHLIIHARKAWLEGLSPKENRDIPPLDYERVYRVKRDFPDLFISVNGGITNLKQAGEHLKKVDGVMVGRAAYQDPFMLSRVDTDIFKEEKNPVETRDEVIELLLPYAERYVKNGGKLSHITRHILDLYTGLPGARSFRRILSQEAVRAGAGIEVIIRARDAVLKTEQA
jgi:tRNA-dihydrouridine synthase A